MKNEMPRDIIPLIRYLLSPFKLRLLCLLIIIAFVGAIPAIDSYLIKKIIDFVEKNEGISGDNFYNSMIFWIAAYAIWWEVINWTWRLYDYFYLTSLPKIKANAITEFFGHTQHHSHRFFQSSLAGFITNRIVEASRSLEMIYSITSEKVIRKLFTVTFAVITLYLVKPIFATIFLIWLVIFLGISGLSSFKVKKLSTEWARCRSLIAGKIVDAVSNISSVRMYNNYSYEQQYLGKYVNQMVVAENTMQWFMFKLRYVLGLTCSLMIFGMLYYLASLRAVHDITVGDFALVLTLCVAVADDIWDYTQELGDLFEEVGSFTQSLDLLVPHQIEDKANSNSLTITNSKIEFRNVSFNYRYNDNLFNDLSVTIEANQKVGLVGYSGSGKSSFVNLITRLYDINKGQIFIDSHNIAEVTQNSLRKNISIIPQEPILFNRTIMDNIRYGDLEASDEEVYEAARKAYIHDDINRLPEGYNSLSGERGGALSGGQRQRIAIARAILKNAPILILDEATSALDSITEKLIQDSLNFLMQNKTVLVIAHRLSTLENMDRILVFEKGVIVEDGSHNELIKAKKLYYKLWKSQIGGFIID